MSKRENVNVSPPKKTICFMGELDNKRSASKLIEILDWLKGKGWVISTGDRDKADRFVIYTCHQKAIKINVWSSDKEFKTRTKNGKNHFGAYAEHQRDDILVARCSVIVMCGDSPRIKYASIFAKQMRRKIINVK